MEKKTKIIYAVVGAIVLGGIGYYFYSKKKPKGASVDPNIDIEDAVIVEETKDTDIKTEKAIPSNLKWVENPKVGSYLGGKLTDEQITKLKGWVDLIKKARAKDSSKWKDSNGLKGQVSDIGHGLYQMKVWNSEMKNALINAK